MISVLEMYNNFRTNYPEATELADNEHIRTWDEIGQDLPYSWFESLANAINAEMNRLTEAEKYKEIFEFIRNNYMLGNSEVKNCIDASFTENLFWQVPPNQAEPYWAIFPEKLKELYVEFHRSEPA